MKREEKLVKNTIILAFGTFFPKLAIFISLPVLTAYLTQAEYGTYDPVSYTHLDVYKRQRMNITTSALSTRRRRWRWPGR